MRTRTLAKTLWGGLAAAGRCQSGATAVVFALSFAVLAPLTLGVFDIYVATEQRAKLQDALDAAALYAARSSAQTNEAVDLVGDRALSANLSLMSGAQLLASSFHLDGSKVVAQASVQLPTFAPAIRDGGPVSVRSEVQRAGKIEVALVLDNTGSMADNGKLGHLQAAAKSLVDKLVIASQRSSDPTPLRISLIPFSSTVRVQGTTPLSSYSDASHSGPGIPAWIDPQGKQHWTSGNQDIFDTQNTDRLSLMKKLGQDWKGCVEVRRAPYDVLETSPSADDPASMVTPYFAPDEKGSKSSNSSGYYNSYLDDPSGGTNLSKLKSTSKYNNYTGGTLRSGYGPNYSCDLQPVIPLTTDSAAVKTAVDAMTATGETNIALGLAWGWQAISPTGALTTKGAAYNTQDLRKVIVLMTDGQNTFVNTGNSYDSFYGGLGYVFQNMLPGATASSSNSQRTSAMDARLALLCQNVKARNIVIYTVRVEVTTGTSSLLQACASSPDKFYDVKNAAALSTAFDAIADSIANLRISH